MSFKDRMLYIYAKYNLNPTRLSRKLGYPKSEKLSRLTRESVKDNLPSFDILQDILKAFPEINARWLLTGEEDMVVEESRFQYGFCKECLKKEGEINRLEKQCAAKDKRIEELLIKGSQTPGGATGQSNEQKRAS